MMISSFSFIAMKRLITSLLLVLLFALPLCAQGPSTGGADVQKRKEEFEKRVEESRKRSEEFRKQMEQETQRKREEFERKSAESRRQWEEKRKRDEEERKKQKAEERRKEDKELEARFKTIGIRNSETGILRVVKLKTPNGVNVLHDDGVTFSLIVDGLDFLADKGDKTGKKYAASKTNVNISFPKQMQEEDYPAGYEYVRQLFLWKDPSDKARACSSECYLALQPNRPRNYHSLACMCNLWYPQEYGGAGTATITRSPYHGLIVRLAEAMKTDGRFFCDLESRKIDDVETLKPGEKTTRCRWMAYSANMEGKPVTVALCSWPEQTMYAFTREGSEGVCPVLSGTWKQETPPDTTVIGPGTSWEESAPQYYCIMAWDGRMAPGAVERAYAQWVEEEKKYLTLIREANSKDDQPRRPNIKPPMMILPVLK